MIERKVEKDGSSEYEYSVKIFNEVFSSYLVLYSEMVINGDCNKNIFEFIKFLQKTSISIKNNEFCFIEEYKITPLFQAVMIHHMYEKIPKGTIHNNIKIESLIKESNKKIVKNLSLFYNSQHKIKCFF